MGRSGHNPLNMTTFTSAHRARRRFPLVRFCSRLIREWHLSPYLQAAIAATGDPVADHAGASLYQAIILDLLRDQLLPSSLIVATPGDKAGIAPGRWTNLCSLGRSPVSSATSRPGLRMSNSPGARAVLGRRHVLHAKHS